jgi:SAM-dependent methyltransferase
MSFDPEAVREFERAGWNRAAPAYEAAFATATRQFVPALLDAAGVAPGRQVLDIACGPGVVTACAAELGATATGLDFSPAMLDIARTRHPALRFDHGDAEALPYADATFDSVVANFGIHHVPRPGIALREAYRVLRPYGRLAFTVWAAPEVNTAWKLLFDAIARCGEATASDAPVPGGGFNSEAQCRSALLDAGFAGITTQTAEARWQHADAGALLAALRAGTARMAALIAAQDVALLPAIVADMAAAAMPYRDPAGIAVPVAAIVAAGVKR